MYVNTNSVYHKKNHIITSNISSKLIKTALDNKVDESTMWFLEAAIRPQTDSELEQIAEETKRIWEYAIDVSTERPYQTIIYTDKEHKEQHNTLKEADKKENILIEDEDQIVVRIQAFVDICRIYKD